MKKEALKKPALQRPVVITDTVYLLEAARKTKPDIWHPYSDVFKAGSDEAALKISEAARKNMTTAGWSCRLMKVVTTKTEVML